MLLLADMTRVREGIAYSFAEASGTREGTNETVDVCKSVAPLCFCVFAWRPTLCFCTLYMPLCSCRLQISNAHPGKKIGVLYCGPPQLEDDTARAIQ